MRNGDNARLDCDKRGFRSVTCIQFRCDVFDVIAHGELAYAEGPGDFFIRQSFRQEREDLEFPGAKVGAVLAFVEPVGDAGREECASSVHALNGEEDIVYRHIFDQVTLRAGFDCLVDLLVEFETGEDDDGGRKGPFADCFERFYAVHLRHAEIEKNDVNIGLLQETDSFSSAGYSGDHKDLFLDVEHATEANTHYRMVINDQQTNWWDI